MDQDCQDKLSDIEGDLIRLMSVFNNLDSEIRLKGQGQSQNLVQAKNMLTQLNEKIRGYLKK